MTDDASMADLPPEAAVSDETLADTPDDFNVEDWLDGLGPLQRKVTIAGKTFTLRSRTRAWRAEQDEALKDLEPDDRGMIILAGHVVSPAVTPQQLLRLGESRPGDLDMLARLAIELDTLPEAQISPRFLPVASD